MVKTNVIPSLVPTNSLASSTNGIRGIKAPVPIADVWFWVWCGLAACALGALAWWFWSRRQSRASLILPAVVTPPHEKARAKLLEALSLLGQPRPFCILVSDTVRTYLEERFNLRAPERTTEEFLEELQSSPLLTLDQKRTLGEFLMGCDLVKFARYEPGEPELRGIYDSALRLVEETQPPPLASEPGVMAAAPQAS